jgi:hypothetical protein
VIRDPLARVLKLRSAWASKGRSAQPRRSRAKRAEKRSHLAQSHRLCALPEGRETEEQKPIATQPSHECMLVGSPSLRICVSGCYRR